jgi:hypothetical protein
MLQHKEKNPAQTAQDQDYFLVDTIKWLKDLSKASSPPLLSGARAGFTQLFFFWHIFFVPIVWVTRNAINVTDATANTSSKVSFGFIKLDLGCMRN